MRARLTIVGALLALSLAGTARGGITLNGTTVGSGGATSGDGWSYSGEVLTLNKEGAVWKVAGDDAVGVRILANATVVLSGVALSGSDGSGVIAIRPGVSATFRLNGVNTLSGPSGASVAGVAVPDGAKATFEVDPEATTAGVLTATGGRDAAAIGVSGDATPGEIVILGGTYNLTAGSGAKQELGFGTREVGSDDWATVADRLFIKGGSVRCTKMADNLRLRPLGGGDRPLVPLSVSLGSANANKAVAVSGLPMTVNAKGMATDPDGKINLWLPVGTYRPVRFTVGTTVKRYKITTRYGVGGSKAEETN